jgi:hypothetical protein
LPTAQNPLTGKEWAKAFASQLEVKSKIFVVPKWMVGLMGIFNPLMKELDEMLYQYDREYIFDSSKFEKQFSFRPTPYFEGIRSIIVNEAIESVTH